MPMYCYMCIILPCHSEIDLLVITIVKTAIMMTI